MADAVMSPGPSGIDNNYNLTLYKWGTIEWQVWPFNTHELDHETATDWAQKEIAGAAIYREWVGENDEVLHMRGRLFPYRLGGLAALELFEGKRRNGDSDFMVRGDGTVMGWFVCERLVRAHTYMTVQGVGQVITFEAQFARAPIAVPSSYFSQIWKT
jgi:hypothetical protein